MLITKLASCNSQVTLLLLFSVTRMDPGIFLLWWLAQWRLHMSDIPVWRCSGTSLAFSSIQLWALQCSLELKSDKRHYFHKSMFCSSPEYRFFSKCLPSLHSPVFSFSRRSSPSYSYDFTAIIVHIKLDLLYSILGLFLLSSIITKLTLCSENGNNQEKVTKIRCIKTTKAYQEDKVLNSL